MKLNSTRLHLFLHQGVCFIITSNKQKTEDTKSLKLKWLVVDGCNVGAGDGLCVCRGRVLGWRWLLCALCVTRPAHSAHHPLVRSRHSFI